MFGAWSIPVLLNTPLQPIIGRVHELLLRQALGNLLYNATVYAGKGAQITLGVEKIGEGTARFSVADSGPGVPELERGRVQQRFVRLDGARSSGGSGLGLAIVAACAKLHSGELMLEDSHPGLRAVFDLKIS